MLEVVSYILIGIVFVAVAMKFSKMKYENETLRKRLDIQERQIRHIVKPNNG
ncbi:MAG: hypothetical protein R2684_14490 [Pyrinomonadaceae bacterium]